MEKLSRIPTPVHVRWERIQHRLVPFLVVILCSAVAWRLWRESPGTSAVGQVDSETAEVRAPVAGRLIDLPQGKLPALFDMVSAGQVLARVQQDGGKWSDVASPINGQIVKVQREVGHLVDSGQSIYTVVADRGSSVTTYLRSDQAIRPEPGMMVEVREQSALRTKTWRAVVARVGVRYEQVPASQSRDRRSEQWGRAVVLSLPADADLKPGELVGVAWKAGSGARE